MRFKKIKSISTRKSFLISSLIHGVPLLIMLLITGTGTGFNKGSAKKSIQDNIVEKPQEFVDVEVIKVKGEDKPKTKQSSKTTCTKYFGGIGIVSNGATGIIQQVIKGYPAYNAGIKEGDLLVTTMDSIIGDIGTEVEVQYISSDDGILHSVIIVREKICVESKR